MDFALLRGQLAGLAVITHKVSRIGNIHLDPEMAGTLLQRGMPLDGAVSQLPKFEIMKKFTKNSKIKKIQNQMQTLL